MATPAVPTNFFVTQANGQVLTQWDQMANATSYVVQRSLDNVTFATVSTLSGSPLATSYLDTTVTSGTAYWYQVQAVGTGSSAFTTSQSVVPSMTGELSLGEIRTRSQQRADRVNSLFVTTPEWNYFINQSLFELYDILITLYEDQYVAPIPVQFSTNGSTFLYPLPDGVISYTNGITGQGTFIAPPFYKLIGVDLGLNTANQAFVTVKQFNFSDRNRYLYPNSASTIYGVFNLEYRLLGSNIQFIPTPSANQPIRLWYIPRLKELLADTDTTTTGVSGWLQYVIVRAAKYALDKEESDTTTLTQELIYLKQRIEESAMNRDAGMPSTIVDVNPFGNNGSVSPFSGPGKGGF